MKRYLDVTHTIDKNDFLDTKKIMMVVQSMVSSGVYRYVNKYGFLHLGKVLQLDKRKNKSRNIGVVVSKTRDRTTLIFLDDNNNKATFGYKNTQTNTGVSIKIKTAVFYKDQQTAFFFNWEVTTGYWQYLCDHMHECIEQIKTIHDAHGVIELSEISSDVAGSRTNFWQWGKMYFEIINVTGFDFNQSLHGGLL